MSAVAVLIGYPLAHSLSPLMHNAAFAALGLNWRYETLPVEPGRLGEAVARVRRDDCIGTNVTVPYKEAIIQMIDGLTPTAKVIGAVNTLVKRGNRLIGHNTDAAGLLADLYAHGVSVANRPVLILGAGGAARAATAACAGIGATVHVTARRRGQAESLQAIAPVQVFDWTPLGLLQACDDCVAILNTTPLGMVPHVDASPWPDDVPFPPDAFAYDLVYNPAETRFTRQARAAGLRAVTGLGMLVEQGALAFELWAGKTAPRDVMRRAVDGLLTAERRH